MIGIFSEGFEDRIDVLKEKVSDLETELLAARYIIMALVKRAPDKMLEQQFVAEVRAWMRAWTASSIIDKRQSLEYLNKACNVIEALSTRLMTAEATAQNAINRNLELQAYREKP